MKMYMSSTLCLAAVPFLSMLAACSKDEPSAVRTAPPSAASAATASAAVAAGQRRFELTGGTATFLIDAPLEKIKGRSTKVRGNLDVDPADLKSGKGQIEFDLDDLKTETFGDADKDGAQTGHAKNWFEIGPDVEAKRREENRWARFTIKAIDDANPTKFATAELKDGKRTVLVQATGDLWMHGVSSSKKVNVALTLEGPPEAPTSLRVVTTQPLKVSLKEHDVKPRDLAGKFLAGSLEKIGQKIDDTAQVSLDLTAKAK
jgi:polyisoprenoid-binding protein YceI